jgi:hypothetical protein
MGDSTKGMTLKSQLRKLIDRLPDNCTADDVHYQVYLIEKIRRGEKSLQRNGGIAHEEVKRRVAGWGKR